MKALHSTVILLFLASFSSAGEWHIEAVDPSTTVDVGAFSSLALDSNGYPHISYFDITNLDLKYARWNGSSWQIETVDSAGEVGTYTSLELDSSGYPRISYYDDTNCTLKYARWDGDVWRIETVDSVEDIGFGTSLALDDLGYPHISYVFRMDEDLKYAFWDGSRWRIETVDSEGRVGSFNSLELDSSNYPHISYCDNIEFKISHLKYARWDGEGWRIEIVDSEGDVGGFSSLALDSSNYPHISYVEGNDWDLKYARWDGSAWRLETVDSEGSVGLYTSLAIDSNDYPHISYGDLIGYPNYNLKYAHWDGAEWRIETVDSEGNVGQFTSIVLDTFDYPHISYYDGDNGDLKYARYEPSRFHLLSPGKGDTIYEFPFTFDWEDHDLDGLESYTLWWGTDPDFLTYNEVTDIGESEYTIRGGIEDGARVYWRVKSLDSEGGEYWAEELDWYFDVDLGGGVDVVDFGVGATDEGVLVNWRFYGETPAEVRVLRSVGVSEPEEASGALPGEAIRWLDTDVEYGVEYRYWLETIEADGTVSRFGPTEAVSIPGAAREIALSVYPSPASGSFTVDYTLPEDGKVTVSLYDLSGRRIATLLDGEMAAGRHDLNYDAAALPPGVYLVHFDTDAGTLTRRVVIAR